MEQNQDQNEKLSHTSAKPEEERKRMHLLSEKKRREAIRQGFDRITAVVPDLDQRQSRSEVHVLDATLSLMIDLLREHDGLQALARQSAANVTAQQIQGQMDNPEVPKE